MAIPIYGIHIYDNSEGSDIYSKTLIITLDNTEEYSSDYSVLLADKTKTKSLAYILAAGNTKTKDTDYKVKKLYDIDKDTAYSLFRDTLTKTKSLGYSVQYPVESIDKTSSYKVKKLYDIDKDLAYELNKRYSKTLSSAYSVNNLTNILTKDTEYSIKFSGLTKTKSSAATVITTSSTDYNLGYSIIKGKYLTSDYTVAYIYDKDVTSTYEVNLGKTKTVDTEYSIIMEKPLSAAYNVQYPTETIDKTSEYSIQFANTPLDYSSDFSVTKSYEVVNSSEYSIIKEDNSLEFSSSYSVKHVNNTNTQSTAYTVKLSNKLITKSLEYNIIYLARYKSFTSRYSVRVVNNTIDKSLAYSIKLANKTLTKTTAYELNKRYTVTKGTAYKIRFRSVEISHDLSYSLELLTNTADYSCGYAVVLSTNLKTKSLAYTLATAGTKSKTSVYKVLFSDTKTYSLEYNIKIRTDITKSLGFSTFNFYNKSKICGYSINPGTDLLTVFSEIRHPVLSGTDFVIVEDGSLFSVGNSIYIINTYGISQSAIITEISGISGNRIEFSPAISVDIAEGIILLNNPIRVFNYMEVENFVYSNKIRPNIYFGIMSNAVGRVTATPEFSTYSTDILTVRDITGDVSLFRFKIEDSGKILPYFKELLFNINIFTTDDDTLESNPYALSFDGNDYVDITPDSLFDDIANNDFTIEFWAYPTDMAAYSTYTRFLNISYDTNNAVQFTVSAENTILFTVKDAGVLNRANETDIIADSWYHIAGTWTALTDEVKLYINGVEANSGGTGTPTNGNLSLMRIGARTDGVTGTYKGSIDEVRVWNYAKTEEEIQADMYKKLVGTEAGLVGYWRFDEGTGIVAEDSSGNSNTGSITGAIWVEGEVPLNRNIGSDGASINVTVREQLVRTLCADHTVQPTDYRHVIDYYRFIIDNLTDIEYLEELTQYSYTTEDIEFVERVSFDKISVLAKQYDPTDIVMCTAVIDDVEYKVRIVDSSSIVEHVTNDPDTIMLFENTEFIYLYIPSYFAYNTLSLRVYKES